MTTTVKIHVNGDYSTTVQQTYADGTTATSVIEGNVPGGREETFYLPHPAAATFEITEKQMAPTDLTA